MNTQQLHAARAHAQGSKASAMPYNYCKFIFRINRSPCFWLLTFDPIKCQLLTFDPDCAPHFGMKCVHAGSVDSAVWNTYPASVWCTYSFICGMNYVLRKVWNAYPLDSYRRYETFKMKIILLWYEVHTTVFAAGSPLHARGSRRRLLKPPLPSNECASRFLVIYVSPSWWRESANCALRSWKNAARPWIRYIYPTLSRSGAWECTSTLALILRQIACEI